MALTSYAGLELFGRYLRRTRFNALVRDVFRGTARWGDYGVVATVRLLVGLLVVGGRRLRHVAYVADDPLFRRFTGLRGLPTARTISRWLKQFTMATVGRLQDLNAGVVARVFRTASRPTRDLRPRWTPQSRRQIAKSTATRRAAGPPRLAAGPPSGEPTIAESDSIR